MTRDDMKNWIKKLCPEIAGWQVDLIVEQVDLAVAAEREACIKACEEDLRDKYLRQHRPIQEEVMLLAAIADCTAAMRARGT